MSLLAGTTAWGNTAALGFAFLGYSSLRVAQRFSKPGWEDSLAFPLEYRALKRSKSPGQNLSPYHLDGEGEALEVLPHDTLTSLDLLVHKEVFSERFAALSEGEFQLFCATVDTSGLYLQVLGVPAALLSGGLTERLRFAVNLTRGKGHLYSLVQLPVCTDPLWLRGVLSKIQGEYSVLVAIRGLNSSGIKKRLEWIRKSTAASDSPLEDIDSSVTFEETSRVLRGLSRGDESIVEASLLLCCEKKQELDAGMFFKEQHRMLPLLSILGLRAKRQLHRSHWVRSVTASDLLPSIGDPREEGRAILRTRRGAPLYFSPLDPRLEALHWLVCGASGSGKSFFTGLVLKRLVEQGEKISVIFIDHNRSFRRLVRSVNQASYFEPSSLDELQAQLPELLSASEKVGTLSGVELSDLPLEDKRAAARTLLTSVEGFLKARETIHPVYLVLDECWNFLRDESLLVQRAFREFRKLNGAVVAITQSLHDFLTDTTGQSIFQNAPIRILLRQGEDLESHRGVLGLNEAELQCARRLRQVRGEFSECLIKTPFLSRVGRLYPSQEEHALLRTDNLRQERVQERVQEKTQQKVQERIQKPMKEVTRVETISQ